MVAADPLASVDAVLAWLDGRGARSLCIDSRSVGAGDAFVAWPGHAVDARQFVLPALGAGAVAALVEADGVDAFDFPVDRVARVAGLKALTGEIASRLAGEPSRRLKVVACTGTNGKTSIAWWTAQALTALGQRCAVIGTLGAGEPPFADRPADLASTGLTTPDPVTLQTALRRFVDIGVAACAVEASSIGLAEHRLDGTQIAVAIFSNFTQDHLDFHGSMAAYWQAKAQLFAWPGLQAASINADDAHGRRLADGLAGHAIDLWTYSVRGPARLSATGIAYRDGGLCFEVAEAGGAQASVVTRLIGGYNVANLLAVLGGLRALGVALADAAGACRLLTPVPGRMQQLPAGAGQPAVVVDYAHTPDALEQALQALQPFASERGGRLWCVFGCGGNRDATKRPVMGEIAARLAQRVVVTSDNPRNESAAAIIEQIVAGVGRSEHDAGHVSGAGSAMGRYASDADDIVAIESRSTAIATAIRRADGRDVILIAGKGHETWQEVAGAKLPFADADEALAALRERSGVVA